MKPGERFNPYGLFNGSFLPEQISRFKRLSLGAKVIYGRLCRFAGEDGDVFPALRTLADETGISERQAQRYIHEVENGRSWRLTATTGVTVATAAADRTSTFSSTTRHSMMSRARNGTRA